MHRWLPGAGGGEFSKPGKLTKMRNLSHVLLFQDSHDSFVRVLQSWRLWLAGAIVGALVAAGVYPLFPPAYRAAAVAVVDHNLEEAWPVGYGPQSYFLERETRKLEALAWHDVTMQLVADQVGDVSVQELREEVLQLSQPSDGGWQFIAEDKDPDRAAQIAAAWAEVFSQQVTAGIEISGQLEQERQEIIRILQSEPDMTDNDARKLVERLAPALEQSTGVSPYVEVSLVQTSHLNAARTVPLSVYILAGSVLGACGLAFYTLIFIKDREKNENLAEH